MRLAVLAVILAVAGAPVLAAPCGGDFGEFLNATAAEAQGAGLPDAAINRFFDGARQEAAVLKAQPLPYRGFETVFNRTLTINFRGEDR